MPIESLEDFGNRWRDRALKSELEVKRLAVLQDAVKRVRRIADQLAQDDDTEPIASDLHTALAGVTAREAEPADEPIAPDTRDLLAALRDLLTVPVAATDHDARSRLWEARGVEAHAILNALLDIEGAQPDTAASQAREALGEHPVTYQPYQAD